MEVVGALGVARGGGEVVNGCPLIADIFDDPGFDLARREALELAAALRRMGEFQPARLGPGAMEYTTLPTVLKRLEPRFRAV